MEYENATQKILMYVELILQTAKQFQHEQFYSAVFGLKIIGHRHPDNNLESHCTYRLLDLFLWLHLKFHGYLTDTTAGKISV
jgi:hypothetical protein